MLKGRKTEIIPNHDVTNFFTVCGQGGGEEGGTLNPIPFANIEAGSIVEDAEGKAESERLSVDQYNDDYGDFEFT